VLNAGVSYRGARESHVHVRVERRMLRRGRGYGGHRIENLSLQRRRIENLSLQRRRIENLSLQRRRIENLSVPHRQSRELAV